MCKTFLFDRELRALGSASVQLPLVTLSGTEVEQSAESWWDAAVSTVRQCLQEADVDRRRVKGISVSSQGISIVPVDGTGSPLRSAISWLDTRAGAQRERIVEKIGEKRIFSITGKRCSEGYSLPKLLWLKQRERKLYKESAKILMPMDFLLARLSGEFVTDHTMASGTMLYDIGRQEWSGSILEAFGLDERKLPAILWGGTPVSSLRREAAESLGLPPNVIVAVGGQDQKVAALGAGIDLERSTISLGTAMAITKKCDSAVRDRRMRMPCFTDLLPGRWVLEGYTMCCSILDWLRQTFFPDRSYEDLNRMAAEAQGRPNPPYFLPFFSGAPTPFFDPDARGELKGLDLSTTPGQIVRGFFEGIAYMIRANLEIMEEISRPVRELRIFGGGSRSDVWCGIISDVVGRPVSALTISESAAVGAAILAGMGTGVYARPEDAFEKIRVRTAYEPRGESVRRYGTEYAKVKALLDRRQRRR